jgi:hypothetical protein
MDSLFATHAPQPFIEQMPAAIAIFDGGMRYQAVSRRHLSDLAWLFSTEVLAPDKVIGRTFFEVSPEAPPRWRDAHDRVLAGEELGREEDFVPRKDGRAVWVRWSMGPWRNVHGRIGGALLISELITEQVEIRHALHESEARFRATFENAAVGITHVAPDGNVLSFAGLWDRWKSPETGEPMASCTIIVTDANALTRPIHDRMPVVLDKADIGPWLNGEAGIELLRPAAEDRLRMWPVSRRVNKTGSGDDDPTLLDEVAA